MDNAKEISVGKKIKQLREFQNVTVEELAERASLSPELIEQIENAQAYPSLAPLIKIARALGVRLGTFLDDEITSNIVLVRKENKRRVMRFPSKETKVGDLNFESLGYNKKDRYMEPFLITIDPSNESKPQMSSHEGEEFLYLLEGELVITYGKETYHLKPGDSIYYDSVVPHNVRSNGKPAKFIAVIYTPV
ncbi:MAG: cupin domain-containing protein [Clostridia bacterium]|nr:cupin domain-containing protein [Clostridia bacterium]